MKIKLSWLALLAIGFINLPGCSDTNQGTPEYAAEQEQANEELGDEAMSPEDEANEE